MKDISTPMESLKEIREHYHQLYVQLQILGRQLTEKENEQSRNYSAIITHLDEVLDLIS